MISIETIRDYCLSKKGVTESFPFAEDVLVFKVMDKIFLLISISEPSTFNVKCNPEKAAELRDMYDAVKPGYHMNKKHWNTIDLNEEPPAKLVWEWIDESYNCVVNGLNKKAKQLLASLK
jgi:predicted DNA-binding protein (MmcQ/YjbR family)